MNAARHAELAAAELPAGEYVRRALALIEVDTRKMALLALADWQRLGIVAPQLFDAVVALQSPSPGTCNGLLSALHSARDAVVASAAPAQRESLKTASTLEAILNSLDKPLAGEQVHSVRALARVLSTAVDAQAPAGTAISLAAALADRMALAPPDEERGYEPAGEALRATAGIFDELFAATTAPAQWPGPWFAVDQGEVWTLKSPSPDFSAVYVSDKGAIRQADDAAPQLISAFGQLLGRAQEQQRDFLRLMAKLKPEEIRGVLLGDFLVGRPVGQGGFGSVHVGRQLSTGRKVAIKILHDGMTPVIKARFRQEAAFLSRFNHAHIVNVLAYGEEHWLTPRQAAAEPTGESWFAAFAKSAPIKTFIAMEWVQGRTLEEVFRVAKRDESSRPSTRLLARWFAESAGALFAVHSAGLVHRDVKPSNLMVTDDGAIKLMDFGVARSVEAEHTLMTTTGRMFGTLVYMSPEQLAADQASTLVGPATDIYSLCATFYELFTRGRVYSHDTQSAERVTTLKLTGQRPLPPRQQAREVPWEIEVILLGGLEIEVADRYRSMEDLQRDVRHYLADEPIEYRRPSLPRRLRLAYRRNRGVANVAAVSLLAAVIGIGIYIHSIRAEQARTQAQKILADENARQSRDRLAASYEEQGRQLLLAGDPTRAVVYLSQAYSMGRDKPALRFLLGAATGAIPAKIPVVQGHTRGIYTAAFSPDGTRIATAGRDGVVKIWDAATGKLVRTLELDRLHEVNGAVFSPDGSRVLAVDDNASGAVWDLASGRKLFNLIGHERKIYSPTFSPDGTRIATASEDRTARIWDAGDGTCLHVLQHGAEVWSVAFNQDGTRVITASDDRSAVLWDVQTGAKVRTMAATERVSFAAFSPDGSRMVVTSADPFAPIKLYDATTPGSLAAFSGHKDVIRRVAFRPDGREFVTSSKDGTARLWNVATGESVVLKHDGQVFSSAYSHDGALVATASRDRNVKIWDAQSGSFVRQLSGHAGYVYDVQFSPDDKRVVTASEDKTARVWDVKTGQLLMTLDGRSAGDAPGTGPLVRTIGLGSKVNGASFSPDGKSVVVSADAVEIHSAATGEMIELLAALTGRSLAACFSPDGRCVAVIDDSHAVAVLSLASHTVQITHNIEPGHPPDFKSIAYSPDGNRIIVGGTSAAWILDATTLNVQFKLPQGPGLSDVARAEFSPDGRLAVTAGADKTAKVWDASTGALKATLLHGAGVNWATFSPDGKWIATAADDQTAVIWDVATGQAVHVLKEGDPDFIVMAVFSRDGRRLVTAGRDFAARVWDTATGRSIATLQGHEGLLTSASFNPDGALVVTASRDGTAMIWDTESGRPLVTLRGHQSDLVWSEFSPDGSRVVTASEDKTVKIWDTHLETRSAAQIADLVARRVPWRLSGERLVPVTLNAADWGSDARRDGMGREEPARIGLAE